MTYNETMFRDLNLYPNISKMSEDCMISFILNLSVELIHSAGLFINVVRPVHVSSHRLLPVIFVSLQVSKRLTELRQSPSAFIWRLPLYLLLSVRINSDLGFTGGFQMGDTSQYIGDNLVNRSITLHEPVIYVSANYRLNGMPRKPCTILSDI